MKINPALEMNYCRRESLKNLFKRNIEKNVSVRHIESKEGKMLHGIIGRAGDYYLSVVFSEESRIEYFDLNYAHIVRVDLNKEPSIEYNTDYLDVMKVSRKSPNWDQYNSLLQKNSKKTLNT